MTELKVTIQKREKAILSQLEGLDFFEIFQLPPTLPIDKNQLEKQYQILVRNNHPDNFFDQELQLAQKNTEIINQGYKELQDYKATLTLLLGDFEQDKLDDQELLREIFSLQEKVFEGDQEAQLEIEAKKKSLIFEIQELVNQKDYQKARQCSKLFFLLK